MDGLTPVSAGLLAQGRAGLVPCTPGGGDGAAGRRAGGAARARAPWCIGRSQLVGKPLAQLLLAANATVTQCHSRTRDLAAVCREADVLVAAVGRPATVTADMVREGAVVIDVGTNRTDAGLVGDVDFEPVAERAARHHPRARRRGPDDDRDAALQHGARGAAGSRRTGGRAGVVCGRWTCAGSERASGWPAARASCC